MKKTFSRLSSKLKELRFLNFFMLSIAGVINSTGVNLMLEPLKFLDGGFSGLSEFLGSICSPYVTMSVFLLILNVPLFIFGAKKQGFSFIIYSVYAIAMYSLWAFLFKSVFNIPELTQGISPITKDDKFISAIFGGMFSGIGTGIVIRYGAGLDGTDVLAILFAKKLGLTIGTFELIFNILMYAIVAFIDSTWVIPLYSLVAYFVNVKTVDFIVLGIDKGKSANIVTSKGKEIAEMLSLTFGRGLTIMNAKGYYSSSSKTMIYCVINRFEISKLKNKVKAIDPNAFIAISDISDAVSIRKGNPFKGLFVRKSQPGLKKADSKTENIDTDQESINIK